MSKLLKDLLLFFWGEMIARLFSPNQYWDKLKKHVFWNYFYMFLISVGNEVKQLSENCSLAIGIEIDMKEIL